MTFYNLRNAAVHLIFTCISLTFLITSDAKSESVTKELDQISVLFPPPSEANLKIYDMPPSQLSRDDEWRIRAFGLRLSPLHPSVWGFLKREHTKNRHLVPIKRYFLRDSEQLGFEVRSFNAKFQFNRADKNYMKKMPHQKDPVFEIGFGGVFKEEDMLDKPLADRSFILRLSAFERLPSGIFERNLERYREIARASIPKLEVGTPYEIHIYFGKGKARVFLNGAKFIEHRAPEIEKGFLTMQTSWHPISLETLSIKGATGSKISKREIQYSGLISGFKRK